MFQAPLWPLAFQGGGSEDRSREARASGPMQGGEVAWTGEEVVRSCVVWVHS